MAGRTSKAAAAGAAAIVLLAAALGVRRLSSLRTADLLRRAIAASEAKDSATAARLCDQVLDRDPGNARALLYRGEAARDLGDPQRALQFWALVPDDSPREAGTARFLEGLLALSGFQARKAEGLFLRATRLNPGLLQPHEKLAQLYQLQMRDAELRRELDAIREVRPWTLNELVASLGSMGRIYPLATRTEGLKKLVAADDQDTDSVLALAECHLTDDRPDEAASLLEKTLEANAGAARARGRLAELRVRNQDVAGARQLLEAHLAADDPVEVWRARGACLAAVGDWDGAAAALERAVGFDPDHQATLYAYGLALERTGRRERAAAVLKEARIKEEIVLQSWRIATIGHERTNALADIVLAIGRLLMQLDRHSDAMAWFEQALKWRPQDASVRAQYAVAKRQAGRAPSGLVSDPIVQKLAHRAAGLAHAPAGNVAIGAQRDTHPALRLVDRHAEAGIEFQYENGATGSKFLPETLGGGVAAIDFDADGWPDLYFTQGRSLPVTAREQAEPRDRLFRNQSGTFHDVTESAGLGDAQYSQGCSAADFDNDGFTDLAVANFGTNVLYRNNGDGTFSDVTASAGISGDQWHSSLAFADLDGDGNLDLYAVTYVRDAYRVCHPSPDRVATCSPLNFEAEQDRLYRNRGDGTFADESAAAGILAPDGKGLGVVIADLDGDGRPDIYVANDGTPNFLFENQTAGPGAPLRFAERGLASGSAVSGTGNSQAGMGIACADLDGDGRLDLYVTNFYNESGTFYRNEGALLFADATAAARLEAPTRSFLGFGTQPIDVNLDGRPELFIANGHIDDFRFRDEPWKMHPQLFFNQGGRFADASGDSGEYFAGEYLGRGVARLDWNRDGRPDLVVVHQDRPAALLANETPEIGRRLIVELHGVFSNRDAIGARISLTVDGQTQIHEICGGDGFFASNERRAILGAGSSKQPRADSLEIRWPGGRVDRFSDIALDARLIVIESRAPEVMPLE